MQAPRVSRCGRWATRFYWRTTGGDGGDQPRSLQRSCRCHTQSPGSGLGSAVYAGRGHSSGRIFLALHPGERLPFLLRTMASRRMSGRLVLVGTPIGNLEDISRPALSVLAEAELVACEDTRRARKLHPLRHPAREWLFITRPTSAVGRGRCSSNEAGQEVALISDAGMPGLSDPGFRLVEACAERGYEVVVVPGPTAVVSALRYRVFLPVALCLKASYPASPRQSAAHRGAGGGGTNDGVLRVPAPNRGFPCRPAGGLGDRRAVVARELTKMYETAHRGELSELLAMAEEGVFRGEIVVVVSGAVRGNGVIAGPEELAARAVSSSKGEWTGRLR